MLSIISFGPEERRPAPARWGCTNLEATPILADPLLVEHHYLPGGEMREHSADHAILCVCIAGQGFVKVGDETAALRANQAVIWPAGLTHKVWTTDASMTILLLEFGDRHTLTPAPEEWRKG